MPLFDEAIKNSAPVDKILTMLKEEPWDKLFVTERNENWKVSLRKDIIMPNEMVKRIFANKYTEEDTKKIIEEYFRKLFEKETIKGRPLDFGWAPPFVQDTYDRYALNSAFSPLHSRDSRGGRKTKLNKKRSSKKRKTRRKNTK